VLALFTEAELAAAEKACGLPQRTTWQGLQATTIPAQSWQRLPTMTVTEVNVCQL
jgi:hypothetical protein